MGSNRAPTRRDATAGVVAYIERELRAASRLLKSHASTAAAWRRWLDRSREPEAPEMTVETVEDGKQ